MQKYKLIEDLDTNDQVNIKGKTVKTCLLEDNCNIILFTDNTYITMTAGFVPYEQEPMIYYNNDKELSIGTLYELGEVSYKEFKKVADKEMAERKATEAKKTKLVELAELARLKLKYEKG